MKVRSCCFAFTEKCSAVKVYLYTRRRILISFIDETMGLEKLISSPAFLFQSSFSISQFTSRENNSQSVQRNATQRMCANEN